MSKASRCIISQEEINLIITTTGFSLAHSSTCMHEGNDGEQSMLANAIINYERYWGGPEYFNILSKHERKCQGVEVKCIVRI